MEKYVSILKRQKQTKPTTAQVGNTNIDIGHNIIRTESYHAGSRDENGTGSTGHGFAAEDANTTYDRLLLRDAKVVGGDNKLNGPDRMVDGILIQTKYCSTSAKSVNAAFDSNGNYRYYDAKGKPMQLEVPADQYDEAVKKMEEKIRNGQVPGVKNPAKAKDIVRKGQVTYQQALNMAKFGTIESLKLDAAKGIISATGAFGISAAITFAKAIWNGEELNIAIEKSVYAGLKIGSAAFFTTIATAQLARTSLNSFLVAPSEQLISLLPSKSVNFIANLFREEGQRITGAAAQKYAAKLLRANFIANAITIVVLSAEDISNAFRGRISGKQLFKNITKLAGGIAGGYGAAAIMGFLSVTNPWLVAAGAVVGGIAGNSITSSIMDKFIEDDAVMLVSILEKHFSELANEYMLSKEEVDIILGDLEIVLVHEQLLQMFASDDRDQYAKKLLRGIIEKTVSVRCMILSPSKEEIISGINRLADKYDKGQPFFSNNAPLDPVDVGQKLLGRTLDEHTAKKAMYFTKQMNTANMQSEHLLVRMKTDEVASKSRLKQYKEEREAAKAEIEKLLGGMYNG